jgi:hypothetical protein
MPSIIQHKKTENFESNSWNIIDKKELESFSTYNNNNINHNNHRKLIKLDENNQSIKAKNNDNIIKLEVGNRVQHDRFGKGTVTAIEGKYPDQKATINFDGIGCKQLLLKFAKLTLIN